MIDIHSHIVFEVDDGSKSIEQSIEMLQEASNAGFKKVILTPHYIEEYYEIEKDEIAEKIENLKEQLENINCNIEILQGNEIYITNDINELLENKQAVALNDKKYVLFELPLNAEAMNLNEVVYQILEKGRIPVLAHPERYPFVQKDPNVLLELIEDGVLMQSNYGSIIGQYGKQSKNTLKKMLEHNMVHLLGSDSHRPQTIYLKINEAIEEIEKIIGKENLENLTTNNPQLVIEGKEIDLPRPMPIKSTIFSKLFH
mgnify:CR=1 FL=1